MSGDSRLTPSDKNGADVSPLSPLPDVPDAGDDSQPLTPPEPVDISTAALNTHAALTAGTLNDGDDRTLYEQALDAYEESGSDEPQAVPADFSPPAASPRTRRAQIYDVS